MLLNGAIATTLVNYAPDWKLVSQHCKALSNRQAQRRFKDSEDYDLRHGPWEDREVRVLMETYDIYGSAWKTISEKTRDPLTGLRRSPNACKTKYNNVVNNKREGLEYGNYNVKTSFVPAKQPPLPKYNNIYLPSLPQPGQLPQLPILPFPPVMTFSLTDFELPITY